MFSAVSRTSPSLAPGRPPVGDSPDNLRFSPSLVNISMHNLMCFNGGGIGNLNTYTLPVIHRFSHLACYYSLETLKLIPDLVLVTHVVPALRQFAQVSVIVMLPLVPHEPYWHAR